MGVSSVSVRRWERYQLGYWGDVVSSESSGVIGAMGSGSRVGWLTARWSRLGLGTFLVLGCLVAVAERAHGAGGQSFDANGGVSCTSASFCMVAGAAVSAVTGQVSGPGEAVSYTSRGWSAPASIDSRDVPVVVSCASRSFCAAIDVGGRAVTYDGRVWSRPVEIDLAAVRRGLSDVVQGLSCPTRSFCVAVDATGNVIEFDGKRWRSPEGISSGDLFSVSCTSSSFCLVGLGNCAPSPCLHDDGYVMTFDGRAWSRPIRLARRSALERRYGLDASISAVSCSSPSFCVAFDDHGRAYRFDHRVWRAPVITETPARGVDDLINRVSCPSSRFCMAITDGGAAIAYDGHRWSRPAPIDPTTTTIGYPAVSCVSAFTCIATDRAGRVLRYGAHRWSSPITL
jgi:hypothetical protein